MEAENETVEQEDAAQQADGKEKSTCKPSNEDQTAGAAKDMKEKSVNKTETEKKTAVANSKKEASEFLVLVEILGYFDAEEFKKLLNKQLNLNMIKIKSYDKNTNIVCISFRTLREQKQAAAVLNGFTWNGKKLKAEMVYDLYKRLRETETYFKKKSFPKAKKMRTSADAIVPRGSIPYDKQFEMKWEKIMSFLSKLRSDLLRTNPVSKNYVGAFKFMGVERSPKINGYHNKCEFTKYENEKNETTVGYRLSSYGGGPIEVSELEDLPHLPLATKWAVKSFEEFMHNSHSLPLYPENKERFFSQIMVRTSELTGELVLMPSLDCTTITEDEMQQLKNELKAYYIDNVDPNAPFKCASLLFEDVQQCKNGQVILVVEHIAGQNQITEAILGLNFRLSPLAFFQINTQSTEVLYKKAIELAAPLPHSSMLDICCGAGRLTLAFAKYCKNVLGVDIMEKAILNAIANASLNKIENCKFFFGNADHYIVPMANFAVNDKAPNEELDLFAVVDPPRDGLHEASIIALRKAKAVNRLIYISSNPDLVLRNFIDLGRPESEKYRGDPFFPKTAVAVEMCRITSQMAMIILFKRCPTVDKNSKDEKQNTHDAGKITSSANPDQASASENSTTAKADESEIFDTKTAEQTETLNDSIVSPMETETTTVTPVGNETSDTVDAVT